MKVQEQIEQSSARMQEHHRNQSAIQKSITEVKTKITERKAYAVGFFLFTFMPFFMSPLYTKYDMGVCNNACLSGYKCFD